MRGSEGIIKVILQSYSRLDAVTKKMIYFFLSFLLFGNELLVSFARAESSQKN